MEQRVACEHFTNGCWRVIVRYGFLEQPDVPHAIDLCGPYGLHAGVVRPLQEKLVRSPGAVGARDWRDRVFARNAGSVTDFFNLPTNRVVELGTRVEI